MDGQEDGCTASKNSYAYTSWDHAIVASSPLANPKSMITTAARHAARHAALVRGQVGATVLCRCTWHCIRKRLGLYRAQALNTDHVPSSQVAAVAVWHITLHISITFESNYLHPPPPLLHVHVSHLRQRHSRQRTPHMPRLHAQAHSQRCHPSICACFWAGSSRDELGCSWHQPSSVLKHWDWMIPGPRLMDWAMHIRYKGMKAEGLHATHHASPLILQC